MPFPAQPEQCKMAQKHRRTRPQTYPYVQLSMQTYTKGLGNAVLQSQTTPFCFCPSGEGAAPGVWGLGTAPGEPEPEHHSAHSHLHIRIYSLPLSRYLPDTVATGRTWGMFSQLYCCSSLCTAHWYFYISHTATQSTLLFWCVFTLGSRLLSAWARKKKQLRAQPHPCQAYTAFSM